MVCKLNNKNNLLLMYMTCSQLQEKARLKITPNNEVHTINLEIQWRSNFQSTYVATIYCHKRCVP